MKKIGYIDYFIDEYHAHNGFKTLGACNENNGTDYKITAVYAEIDAAGGMSTDAFCEKYGTKKCATIAELVSEVDYVIIFSPDNPEKKLAYAKEALKAGKPTFLDKTFTDSYASALEIFKTAEEYSTPFFSSSSLRYADELRPYVGATEAVFVSGSGVELKDYAVHYLEIIMTVMGTGVKGVRWEKRGNQEWMNLEYADGRAATAAISMGASYLDFNAFIADKSGDSAHLTITSDFFLNQMKDVLRFFETKTPSFSPEETKELMRVYDAVFKSKAEGGAYIAL